MKLYLKILIAILCGLFLNDCTHSKNELKTSAGLADLNGRVKSYTETSYILIEKFGEIQKGSIVGKLTEKFDEKGKIIERIDYNSDGALSAHIFYDYNDKGDLIKQRSFDNDGRLQFKKIFQSIYADHDKKVKKDTFDAEERLEVRMLFEYNDYGKMIRQDQYDASNSGELKLSASWIYIYDKNQELIKRQTLRGNGSISNEINYGDSGILTRISFESDGNIRSKTEYKYDENGNLVEESTHYPASNMRSTKHNEFDKKNNLMRSVRFNFNGDIEYERAILSFDRKGNWIEAHRRWYKTEMMEIMNLNPPMPATIVEREINYYN